MPPPHHPRTVLPPKPPYPLRGNGAASAICRITFIVAAFPRQFSRIDPPLLQFRAHPSRVSLRLRTGASPVLRLRPPQAGKQTAERTVPPPALHFRISPAYRNIYPHHEAPWGTMRNKPAQGRATFTTSVLRWWCGGGIYCPSPSPPGFPLSEEHRLGLLSPLRYAPFRSQTLHQLDLTPTGRHKDKREL